MDQFIVAFLTGQPRAIVLALVPIALALLNGLIVRLSKDDAWPAWWSLRPAARPWVVVALGVAQGALLKFAAGAPWGVAIVGALVAAFGPILGHEFVVKSARGGKEIPIPFLTTPAKPPVVPPLPMLLLTLAWLLALGAGCASWWGRTPSHVVDVAKIVTCVMTEIDKVPQPAPADIALKCGLENADAVLDLVRAQRAAEARHAKPAAAPACPSASVAPSASASTKPAPSASK